MEINTSPNTLGIHVWPAVQLMLKLHSEADSVQAPTDTAIIPLQTGTPLPTETFKNGNSGPAMFGRGETHNLKRRVTLLLRVAQ